MELGYVSCKPQNWSFWVCQCTASVPPPQIHSQFLNVAYWKAENGPADEATKCYCADSMLGQFIISLMQNKSLHHNSVPCMCVHTHTHTHTHTHMHAHTHARTHACTHTHAHAHTPTCTHTAYICVCSSSHSLAYCPSVISVLYKKYAWYYLPHMTCLLHAAWPACFVFSVSAYVSGYMFSLGAV